MISDIKALFKVLFMFLPLPAFWTLFDQQVSQVNTSLNTYIVEKCDTLVKILSKERETQAEKKLLALTY